MIYLDNAATTRVVPEVAAVVGTCMEEEYGNPASAHFLGIGAEARVKEARGRVLAAIGDPDGTLGDLYWTSGGTEGDALGVMGAARALIRRGQHLVCSAIEHSAVRNSARQLEVEGFTTDLVPASAMGLIEVEQVVDRLTDETVVVAVMLVNNEIGTIQPVADIARAVKARRPDAHVHCDAVQALGKVPVDVRALGVDSLALAAHKLHGPKGVGALWVRKGARLVSLWSGGGQQGGLRAGTLNVPGIAGMGEAVRLAMDGMDERVARWRALGDTLVQAAQACPVAVQLNGAGAPRAPHIVSLGFADVPAEPLLHVLESRGVLVSAGSACASRSKNPSAVLQAIGADRSHGTIRLSFGRDTTAAQVEEAARVLVDAVGDFR